MECHYQSSRRATEQWLLSVKGLFAVESRAIHVMLLGDQNTRLLGTNKRCEGLYAFRASKLQLI